MWAFMLFASTYFHCVHLKRSQRHYRDELAMRLRGTMRALRDGPYGSSSGSSSQGPVVRLAGPLGTDHADGRAVPGCPVLPATVAGPPGTNDEASCPSSSDRMAGPCPDEEVSRPGAFARVAGQCLDRDAEAAESFDPSDPFGLFASRSLVDGSTTEDSPSPCTPTAAPSGLDRGAAPSVALVAAHALRGALLLGARPKPPSQSLIRASMFRSPPIPKQRPRPLGPWL